MKRSWVIWEMSQVKIRFPGISRYLSFEEWRKLALKLGAERWGMMAIDVKQFELDRMMNMMRSFGWTVVKSEFAGDRIIVQMEKVVKPEIPKA